MHLDTLITYNDFHITQHTYGPHLSGAPTDPAHTLVRAVGSNLYSSMASCTTSAWPFRAAKCSMEAPSLSVLWCRDSILGAMYWIVLTWPPSAARWRAFFPFYRNWMHITPQHMSGIAYSDSRHVSPHLTGCTSRLKGLNINEHEERHSTCPSTYILSQIVKLTNCLSQINLYRIARNYGGKNIWRIALIMAFGGFYFGGWVSLIP